MMNNITRRIIALVTFLFLSTLGTEVISQSSPSMPLSSEPPYVLYKDVYKDMIYSVILLRLINDSITFQCIVGEQSSKRKTLSEILSPYQEKRYPLLSKLTAYTHLLKFAEDPYSEKIYQKLNTFLTWNWDQYNYIETTQKCPPKLISGQELKEWQDEIITSFPKSALIRDQILN